MLSLTKSAPSRKTEKLKNYEIKSMSSQINKSTPKTLELNKEITAVKINHIGLLF